MPAIPLYQRRIVADSTGVQPRANPPTDMGQALRQIGQELGDVGQAYARDAAREAEKQRQALEHSQRESAKAWTAEAISNDHVQWADWLSQAQETAKPGGAGFTGDFLKAFDEQSAKALPNAPDDTARAFYKERRQALRTHYFDQARGFESRQILAHRAQQRDTAIDNVVQIAARNPEQAKMMAAEVAATFEGSPDAAVWREKLTGTASKAATLGLIERAPLNAKQQLDAYFQPNPETKLSWFVSSLDPQTAATLQRHAQTESERGVAGVRTGLAAQERDLQAMVMAGVAPPAGSVPSPEAYIAAFGPDGARRYQTEVETYLRVGDGIRRMRTASPQERAALIAAAEPVSAEGFAEQKRVQDAMKQAAAHIDKRMQDDPAMYAAEVSPRVQEAAAVLAQEVPAGVAKQAGYDKSRAAVESYAVVQNAEQQRLGVANPQLLTDTQAKAIVQQFHDQRSGGKNAAELVSGLEQTWGRWWPQVFGQLSRDEKLPPSALVIPNMKDAGARTRLAEWSTMKPADRKALLAPSDVKDINEKLLSQFGAAAQTFSAQGGAGQRTVATVIDQAEILAQSYRAQGKSVGAAAQQAFDEVLGHAYDFIGTYRVPKEQKPSKVEAGAKAVQQAAEHLLPLPGYPGMDEAALKAQTQDAVRRHGIWVTNRDESGLILMLQGQDGGMYPVARQDGKPVEMSWSALRGEAMTQQTLRGLKSGRLPDLPKPVR